MPGIVKGRGVAEPRADATANGLGVFSLRDVRRVGTTVRQDFGEGEFDGAAANDRSDRATDAAQSGESEINKALSRVSATGTGASDQPQLFERAEHATHSRSRNPEGASEIALLHAGIVEPTVRTLDEVEHVEPSGSEAVGRDDRARHPNGRLECTLQTEEDRVHALLQEQELCPGAARSRSPPANGADREQANDLLTISRWTAAV